MEESISDQEDEELQTTKEWEIMEAINKKKENLACIQKMRQIRQSNKQKVINNLDMYLKSRCDKVKRASKMGSSKIP